MSLKATTLAQVLKSAGYTTGIFGKWHLGDEDAYQPDRRGFDEVFIHGAGGIGQTYPGSCGDAPGNTYFDPAILHNGKFEKTKGYCTDVFFGQAIRWIDSKRAGQSRSSPTSRPTPRTARTSAPRSTPRCTQGQGLDQDAVGSYGMIANIDDNVGGLLAKLKEWDLERKTLVIFMNDNGAPIGSLYNAGMRSTKVYALPGRHACPLLLALARHSSAGRRRETGSPPTSTSFPRWPSSPGPRFPTTSQLDGRSLVPLLKDPKRGVARPVPVRSRRALAQGQGRRVEVRPVCASAPTASAW